MRYGFNIEKVIRWASPETKRNAFDIAWMKALWNWVSVLHARFIAKNLDWDTDLKYAPGRLIQVRQLLRDRVGPGIEIVNNKQQVAPVFSYDDGDALNPFSYDDGNQQNPFSYDEGQFDPDHVNFTVQVPLAVTQIDGASYEPFFAYDDGDANNLFSYDEGNANNPVSFDEGDALSGFAQLTWSQELTEALVRKNKQFNKTFNIEIIP